MLFIGISADDVAAGGILGRLRSIGVDPGGHFWLTDRLDEATDQWAENIGLELIRYDAGAGHDPILKRFFQDLRKYVPQDREADPVYEEYPGVVPPLPKPQPLALRPPEEIRNILSAHAARILQADKSSDEKRREYNDFVKEYAYAVHNSWYVSTEPPDNVLFGHEVEAQIGSGAFGSVFKARAPHANRDVAIKLLLYEIRSNKDMLSSFRRGVSSMRILSEAGIKGMVPYLHAYELPPCTIMEFVDGPNLEEAVRSG